MLLAWYVMAKFKAAKSKSKSGSVAKSFRAVPCIIVLICAFALLLLLFRAVLPNAK